MFFYVEHINGKREVAESPIAPRMHYDGGTIIMRSCGYETLEELRKDQCLQDACSICGSTYAARYAEPIKSEMLANNVCFTCHFWTIHMPEVCKGQNVAIINGGHYTIGPEPNGFRLRDFLGMAGREFHIEFADGRRIVTHNLWYQGSVPERFRDRYQDNATFGGGAERVVLGDGTTAWQESSKQNSITTGE